MYVASVTVALSAGLVSASCRHACRSAAPATSRARSSVSNVPALLYVPSAALYSPVKRSARFFPERLLT